MDQYFVLRDHVGVTADGNLEPLVEIGLTVAVPIMREGELVEDPHRYVIRAAETLQEGEFARFIPDTRIVHVVDPRIVDGLTQSGMFERCEPPNKKMQAEQRKEVRAAKQEAGTHEPDPAENPPANATLEV